jgi:hypothetical protein
MDALEKLDYGRLVLETPPDPSTGATSIELDPLEWILVFLSPEFGSSKRALILIAQNVHLDILRLGAYQSRTQYLL